MKALEYKAGQDKTYAAFVASALKPTKSDDTSDIKNYQYAVSRGFKGSFEDWIKKEPGTIKEYEYAVKQGYKGSFEEWVKDVAKARATNVNLIEDKEKLATIEGKLYFARGSDKKDISEYVNSRQFRLDMLDVSDKLDSDKAKMFLIYKKYNSILESMANEIKPLGIDEKTKTAYWEVVWKDGSKEVIKRALY